MSSGSLRDVARVLGVTYDSARAYASAKRYPDFPDPVERYADGRGKAWDLDAVVKWGERRPGQGGGHLRADPAAAARKGWANRGGRSAPHS